MRKLFFVLMCAIVGVSPMFAQYTVINASKIADAGGSPLASGVIHFVATDGKGNRIAFRLPDGGQGLVTSVDCNISNGAIGGSCRLADTMLTNPVNLCYQVTITDNVTGEFVQGPGYNCYQPTGSTDNFDNFVPNNLSLGPAQVGPPGPQGEQGPSGPGGIGCGAANCVVTSPAATQAITQPANTNFSINTSGTGKVQYNGAEVISGRGYGKFAYPGINLFGDSITCGNGATSTATWYATLLANSFNGVADNQCRAGDQAADVATVQMYPNLNPGYNYQPATTIMIGVNDYRLCGISTGCQNNYAHALMSDIAWAAIPNQIKVLMGRNTQVVSTTGTWSADSTLQTNLALKTTVSGSAITFTTLTPSTVVYVAWMATDGDSATGSLSCDSGAVSDTLNAFGYNGQAIATGNGTTTVPFANRYTFAASTTHTCTVTASASSGNPFTLVWAGSPQSSDINSMAYPTANPPRVFVGGVIRQQGGVQDSDGAIFDNLDRATANQLQADGLNVFFVDTRSAVNTTTDFSGGTLPNQATCPISTLNPVHPGDCGHQHIADAFMAVAQPVAAAFAVPPQLNLNYNDPTSVPWVTLANTTSNSRLTNNQLYMNGEYGKITWSDNASSIAGIHTGFSPCGVAILCAGNGVLGDYSGSFWATHHTANSPTENNDLAPDKLQLNHVAPITWSNADSSLVTKVTGISQLAPGVVGIGNGTQGDTSGELVLRQIRPSLSTAPTAGSSCAAYPNGTLALGLDGHASSCASGLWTSRW